ncbi:MAG: type II secretion system protein [Candidatus Moranbacteria bacterium]|nr:type II secretion system protein [Candidatus Moranbacteria bacterium]
MIRVFSQKNRSGFTLIEVLVSVAIFLVVMVTTSYIFTRAFAGYKETKALQHDIENAQYVLNLLAKELRTSSIADFGSDWVQFIDYSQSICFRYRINGGSLQVAKVSSMKTLSACQSNSFVSGDYTTISTGTVSGKFNVIRSDPTVGSKRVGKVTTSLVIREGTAHEARIQTTVSLRDFGYIVL